MQWIATPADEGQSGEIHTVGSLAVADSFDGFADNFNVSRYAGKNIDMDKSKPSPGYLCIRVCLL
jgi:hypothetical protein